MSYYFVNILNVYYISYLAKNVTPCEYYTNSKRQFVNHQSVKCSKYFRMTCLVSHFEKLVLCACLDKVNGILFVWNLQPKHIAELYVCGFRSKMSRHIFE